MLCTCRPGGHALPTRSIKWCICYPVPPDKHNSHPVCVICQEWRHLRDPSILDNWDCGARRSSTSVVHVMTNMSASIGSPKQGPLNAQHCIVLAILNQVARANVIVKFRWQHDTRCSVFSQLQNISSKYTMLLLNYTLLRLYSTGEAHFLDPY